MKAFWLWILVACAPVLAAERPPLLKAGTKAPDFTVETAEGKGVRLSDYRGKVVLVDFWATWCGPCKASMPRMETLHQKLANQGLVVLGVCVWDKREKFDAWQAKPQVKTSYLKVFDPSRPGRDIAKKLYSVSGIPTFYVVDREGNIAYAGNGAGERTYHGLEQALAGLGLKP